MQLILYRMAMLLTIADGNFECQIVEFDPLLSNFLSIAHFICNQENPLKYVVHRMILHFSNGEYPTYVSHYPIHL